MTKQEFKELEYLQDKNINYKSFIDVTMALRS